MSVATLLTAEQLSELPEVPGKRFELIDGELIEVPVASIQHALIVVSVFRLLVAVADRTGGYAFPDAVGYMLSRDPDVVRVPDASYVSPERVVAAANPSPFWPGSPDLAVEVISPHDRNGAIDAKVRAYLDVGAQVVWVLWPDTRSVTISDVTGVSRHLGPDDALDGGDLLPGLRFRVADLFPPAT